MSNDYSGEIAVIPLGKGGLFTDASQSDIPLTSLARAYNANTYRNVLEKDPGSVQWNQTSFGSGVVRFQEVFLNSTTQRVYSLLQNGTIVKSNDAYNQIVLSPRASTDPSALNPSGYTTMLAGGNEQLNFPKKVFVFTGYDPVQVLSGDATTHYTISNPPLDWTGTNQPFGAFLFQSQVFAFGCPNNPHQIYVSSASDQEDYTTVPLNFVVYPGEGETIVGGAVFRGTLFLFKYPTGIYTLVSTDPSPANWYFTKYSDEAGAASPQSFATVRDDLLIANNYGSISSLQASLVFGDVEASDVFHSNNCFEYVTNEIRADVVIRRGLLWDSAKGCLYGSFQSDLNYYNDRICKIDLKNPNASPKITWSTKDNANCLEFISSLTKVRRPCYGANDGYIYQLDQSDYYVGNVNNQVGYTFDCMTPHMDFSQSDARLGEQVKNFDFLEIVYQPTGDWNLSLDVYLDGRFSKTYYCNLGARSNLNELPLDTSPIDGLVPLSRRFKIGGSAKRIAVRMYNSGVGQNVKLVRLNLYYTLSGTQQTIR